MFTQETVINLDLLFIPILAILIVALVGTIIWIIALVDFLKTENMDDDRLLWGLLIILTHFIGAILWFLIGRPKYKKIVKY